uniref:Phosphatidic acid phosphatase type 2/haloperoxidase domain-containing protein n=1 Tax=Polytomella parva TaxID=51329 RepID=A0A7S0YJE7_9CHLO|mmetsp:Transcript_29484/g.54135  ORF Transcript_29484/g.54135 Transcript_29484/m.54135 type:complete len:417 (+) Transcript_29484:307-1557(+)|eukprot:CAMPEP_0175067818 /NCGR_PEP_ID=MMETSP0052_2-20121109/17314_1 /TAXON_ID=51329 ORGANISM="Polytomella parva, Strain SAG 63-3" /NCGR_SAMPLE_ID=MMETSP0052_2 /ASSEMBLY_ACC=CAM_ASM_000194 /LENGTH=416 /DNA_ID=CAMNT_0016334751 /DNA_START=205 /DNA_END=1455 /DNA_ORIENTATION=-
MDTIVNLIFGLPTILLLAICVIPSAKPLIRKHITPVITQIVHDQVPFIIRTQKRQSKLLDAIVTFCSMCVSVEFYLTALPPLYWYGFKDQTAFLVLCLSTATHLVNALKDLLGCPRPYHCNPPINEKNKDAPRVQVHEEMKELEFGAPSMHICLTLLLNLYLTHSLSTASPWVSAHLSILYPLCVIWALFVGWTRLYLGVHTPIDLFLGFFLGLSYFFFFRLIESSLLTFLSSSPSASGGVLLVFLFILAFYPHPTVHTASFSFSVTFLGAAQGFYLGHHQAEGLYERLKSLHPTALTAFQAATSDLHFAIRVLVSFVIVAVVKIGSRALLVRLTPKILDLFPDEVRRSWQPPALIEARKDNAVRKEGTTEHKERGLAVRGCDGVLWDVDSVRRYLNYVVTVAAVPFIDHLLHKTA